MPLQRLDEYEMYPAISMRGWKQNEVRTYKFLDNGRDITTAKAGFQVIFTVEDKEGEKHALFVKPSSALHIGLNPFIPLKDKTLSIAKMLVNDDVLKGTRYIAELIE